MDEIIIGIEKKNLLLVFGLIVFLIAVGLLFAYGGSDPSEHGHDSGELEGVCLSDGTNCPSLGGTLDCYKNETNEGEGFNLRCDIGYVAVSWTSQDFTRETDYRTFAGPRDAFRFFHISSGEITSIKCCRFT
ncbi:hypothetical protein GF386_00025 [Candidatus Pacearchaeota archaeon]|nr:hypothetical protein [Candidatus Pacearchaeota archaeon]MBD3282666.1 hypothetical protein [Candidatus Pacearchaeota archaeon]